MSYFPGVKERFLFPCIEAKSKSALSVDVRLGEHASSDIKPGGRWKEVSGTDTAFVEKYRPISNDHSLAINVLSERVRSIIDDLAAIPPRGITVLMEDRFCIAYKSDDVLSLDDLSRFVVLGKELADSVL